MGVCERRLNEPPGSVTAGTATQTSPPTRLAGIWRSTKKRVCARVALRSGSQSERTCSSPKTASRPERVGDALIAGGYRGFDHRAVAYGDPDSVAEQLSVYGALGFTDIIIRTMSPLPSRMGADAAARSVELAAHVRSRLA